jgi:hypothetical protein
MASTIKSGSNNDLYIQTDGVDRIVVDSNGNTSVVGELEVNSSSSATWSNITNTAGSGNRYSGIKMQDGATINSHIYTNHQDGNFAIRNDFAGGVTRFYTTPSGGALQESMAVNGNGYVTKPYQPAFMAILTVNNQSGDLVMTSVYTNIGGHYNSGTGRFTAPVAGTYYFAMTSLEQGGTGEIRLKKNGSGHGTYGYMAAANDTAVVIGIFTLSAGDYVSAYALNGVESNYTSFSGYLVG